MPVGFINPIQELYHGRYVIGTTVKARRKWEKNGSWIIAEQEKISKDIKNAYGDEKELYLDPKSPFESSVQINKNIFPEAEIVTERAKQMKIDRYPETTNQMYGLLPWYSHTQHERYRFA